MKFKKFKIETNWRNKLEIQEKNWRENEFQQIQERKKEREKEIQQIQERKKKNERMKFKVEIHEIQVREIKSKEIQQRRK